MVDTELGRMCRRIARPWRAADRPQREHVVAVLQRQRLRPDQPGRHQPGHQPEDQDQAGTSGVEIAETTSRMNSAGMAMPASTTRIITASIQPPA